MKSLTPLPACLSRTAKKRMFLGESSWSRCNEVEVLGISPPANGSSASKSSKQKEVICHEIIDIDVEDDRETVLLSKGDVDQNGKGKEVLSNSPNDQRCFTNDDSWSDVQMSENSPEDDSSSNMFFGEDEWINTYYDDIVFDDDYDVVQSRYDRVDIPPEVEMPFPWLPDCPQNNTEPLSNVSTGSSSQGNSNDAKHSTDSNSSSPIAPKKSLLIKDVTKPLNLKKATRSALQGQNRRLSTSPLEFGERKHTSLSSMMHRNSESSSGGSLPQKMVKGPSKSIGKSKRKFHASHLYSGPYNQFPSGEGFLGAAHNRSGYPNFPSLGSMNQYSESSWGGSWPQKMVKGTWRSLGKGKRRFDASHIYSGPYDQSMSGLMCPSAARNHCGYPNSPSLISMMHQNSVSSSGGSLPQKKVKGLSKSVGTSERRFHASHLYSGTYNQFPSGVTFSGAANIHSGCPNFRSGQAFPSTVHNHGGYAASSSLTNLTRGYTYSTAWHNMNMHMFKPFMGFVHPKQNAFFPIEPPRADQQNGEIPSGVEPKNLDEISQNFERFKKFESVEDFSDHHYSKQNSFSTETQPPKQWAKRIQEEWKILEKDLPDTIFVRVYESRMDLLRAVIVGAEGTPYHDGLFFFDFHFPVNYPNSPPQVQYHSGGLRINPNLYNGGKVCLSLLNTWSGNRKEMWIPGVSTILQVLISIQGLILNAKPFFNEPGCADMAGSKSGEWKSLEYNKEIFIYSLQTMVYTMRRPPKYFEDFAIGHFFHRSKDIMVACQAYLDGAQVGCLVKGGVQDVDEGDKCGSLSFKNNLVNFFPTLINAFSRIGVKDCDKFLSSAQNTNGGATASAR